MPPETLFSRRSVLSALSLLPAVHLLRGQQTAKPAPPAAAPETAPKFSADVKLVNVFATVRDKSGKIVKDLTKDNFTLEEEGQPQTVKFFEAESSLPLNIGLMVDTSGSQARVLNDERSAGLKFFDRILSNENDQAFVLHFDYESELLQDFTHSREKLDKALDELEVGRPQQQQPPSGGGNPPGGGGGYPQGGNYPGGGYPGGGGRRYPQGGGAPGRGGARGGTKMYDAVLLASEELMSKQQGRKAVILLTDGVDTGSKVTLFEAIRAAQKADTLVYSILFTGSDSYGSPGFSGPGMGRRGGMGGPMPPSGGGEGRPDGKKILQQFAEETGGHFYSVSHFHPLDKIFGEIEDELRSQYNLGYTSNQPSTEAGLYRHIHLTARTAKKKDLVVQARAGYYTR